MLAFFFYNYPATTEISTLSLHDALPISRAMAEAAGDTTYFCVADGEGNAVSGIQSINSAWGSGVTAGDTGILLNNRIDRKSTRLNSSHGYISYAVFCLKKKKINNNIKLR